VVSFTARLLYPPGKSRWCPLDRRLGGPQSQSGRREEEKILDSTGTRTRPLGRPARSQSLYQLRYSERNKNHVIILGQVLLALCHISQYYFKILLLPDKLRLRYKDQLVNAVYGNDHLS
jgi:hypothetical protein